jgi:hypothetical protein
MVYSGTDKLLEKTNYKYIPTSIVKSAVTPKARLESALEHTLEYKSTIV